MAAQNFEYELKAKNRIQISAEYGISLRVLALRIKKYELDIPQGDILPKHQKVIYEALGYPSGIKKEYYADV